MSEYRAIGPSGTIIAAFIMGAVIGWILKPSEGDRIIKGASELVVKIDTVQHVVERQAIYVRDARARIDTVRATDTVYQTPAYVASLDTVIRRDTLGVRYAFPQHTFSVALRTTPDTVRLPQVTITQTKTEQRPWWIDALTHLGAAAVGYAAGSAR